MDVFFTRRPMLQSTPHKQDPSKPHMLNTFTEIEDAWDTISLGDVLESRMTHVKFRIRGAFQICILLG